MAETGFDQPKEQLSPVELETQKLLKLAEVRRPLFLAEILDDRDDPEIPQVYLDLAKKEFKEGKRKEATDHLEEALFRFKKMPEDDSSWSILPRRRKTENLIQVALAQAENGLVEEARQLAKWVEIVEAGALGPLEKALALTGVAAVMKKIEPGQEKEVLVRIAAVAEKVEDNGDKRLVSEHLAGYGLTEEGLLLLDQFEEKDGRQHLFFLDYLIEKAETDVSLILARRLGGKVNDFGLHKLFLLLLEKGKNSEAFGISQDSDENSFYLKAMAREFFESGQPEWGLEITRRITDYFWVEAVGYLVKAGKTEEALGLMREREGGENPIFVRQAFGKIAEAGESEALWQQLEDCPWEIQRALFFEAIESFGKIEELEKRRESLLKALVKLRENRFLAGEGGKIKSKLAFFLKEAGLRDQALPLAEEAWQEASLSSRLDKKEVLLRNKDLLWELKGKEWLEKEAELVLAETKILNYKREEVVTMVEVSDLFFFLGDQEKGRSLIEAAMTEAEAMSDERALYALANLLISGNHFKEALRLGERLKEFDGWYFLAENFLKKGQAEAAFVLAGQAEGEKGIGLGSLVGAFGKAGRPDLLLKLSEKIESEDDLVALAQKCLECGLIQAAVSLTKRIKTTWYLNSLSRELIDRKNFSEAWQVFGQVGELDNGNEDIFWQLGDQGFQKELDGLTKRTRKTDGIFFQKLLRRKIAEKVFDYEERRGLAEERPLDLNLILDDYRQKGEEPGEEIFEALTVAGVSPFIKMKFYRLLSGEKEGAMRRKTDYLAMKFLTEGLEGWASQDLVNFLKTSDIDLLALRKEWQKYRVETVAEGVEHWEMMRLLEESAKGSVTALRQNFGIIFFGRYSSEMLLSMLAQQESQKPYGILLLAKHDWNRTFMLDGHKRVWRDFYDQIKDTYRLMIVEAGNKWEIARGLVVLKRLYQQQKIGFLVVGAHGSPNNMRFGEGRDEEVSLKDLKTRATERLKNDYYAEGMPLVFISCSTGKEGGIAQRFSAMLGTRVVGPDTDTSGQEIKPVFDNGRIVKLEVSYMDSGVERSYEAGDLTNEKLKARD